LVFVRKPLPWLLRLTWLVLPLTVGPAAERAVDGAGEAVATTAAVLLWAAWVVPLAATLIPHPLSLTLVRVAAPAALAVAVAAAVDGEADAVALGAGAVTALLPFAPAIGEWFVNGVAYGDERRLPLRIPALLLAGPVEVAWALVVAGVAAGPLLLAAGQWVAGGVAVAAGLPLAVIAFRSLYGLARRWLVFVPAGVVLHDPMTMADPMLFRRNQIRRLGPAPADTTATDLTQNAAGLAIEIELVEPVGIALVQPRTRSATLTDVDRLLVVPTRPGVVVAEAERRRIRVAQAATPPPSTSSPR
jgi:hypothetical protein